MNLGVSCLCLEPPLFWTRQSGEGFDEESSKRLQLSLREAMGDFFSDKVISRGHVLSQIRGELEEIIQECSREDWDNYAALPINPIAVEEALRVLNQLDLSIGIPDVVPEPNGGIGFEWRKGTRRVLALSFVGQHTISYAGIYESGTADGTEYFDELLPFEISNQFRRLTA